jgi:hypothetical protein
MGALTAALATVFGVSPMGPAVAAAPSIAMQDAPRPRAIGGASTRITNGALEALEPNTELRGQLWYGRPGKMGIADRMMRDGHVRQSGSYVTSPQLAATWRFRPGGKRPIDREAADFATWCVTERIKWAEILKRTILDYFAHGFALVELTDDYAPIPVGRFPLHPGGGRGVVITGAHQIPGWSVHRWIQSKASTSQIAAVEQYVQGSDGEDAGYRTIPAERLLRFTWDQEGADFAGFALLRSAYAPWKMKIAFQTILAMKHERLGLPVPVATAAEGASDPDIDAVEAILGEMRANARGALVLDYGWTFKWEGATASDGSNLEMAIATCNQDIAYAVSAAYMLLGLTGKSGSYALGSTQQGQYHLATKAQAGFFAGVWNLGSDGWSPIERLTRLNYGTDVAAPILEARNLPTSNWADRIPMVINAKVAGLIRTDARTEDTIREVLELDPYDGDGAFDAGGTIAALEQPEQDVSQEAAVVDPEDDADDMGADAPDQTTAKEDQTIFGYHLQYGIAKINEARRNLNLPPVPYGEQTVPEFLASLDTIAPKEEPTPVAPDEQGAA